MIEGIDIEDGRAALARLTGGIWWRAHSPLLCAGCATTLPGFRFHPADRTPSEPPQRTGERPPAGFAFVRDEATETWARAAGARLLMPSRQLVAEVSDKLALPELASEAGVQAPASITVRDASPERAAELWSAAGGRPLVAQLGVDGRTGSGTLRVSSAAELQEALRRWRGRDVKVSELVEGIPITVSGCVGADRTLVSGLSHQLVGFGALTGNWAAHCGNQLLRDGDLPMPTAMAARASCRQLGEALRSRGYRGMFGVDAIADAGRVAVIEINARIQSVSSLVGLAEADRGFLPTQGAHLLAHLLERLPASRSEVWPRRPLSQVVVYAEARTRIDGSLEAGLYRLGDSGEPILASTDPTLGEASGEEGAVWPFVTPGDVVSAGARLAVLQLPDRVAPLSASRELLPDAERWVRSIRRALRRRARAETGAL